MKNNTAYISGSISNDPNYKEKFSLYESYLLQKDFIVMNPAVLPEGFEYKYYMNICFPMIDACEFFFILPDFNISEGSKIEIVRAIQKNKKLFFIKYKNGNFLEWAFKKELFPCFVDKAKKISKEENLSKEKKFYSDIALLKTKVDRIEKYNPISLQLAKIFLDYHLN